MYIKFKLICNTPCQQIPNKIISKGKSLINKVKEINCNSCINQFKPDPAIKFATPKKNTLIFKLHEFSIHNIHPIKDEV